MSLRVERTDYLLRVVAADVYVAFCDVCGGRIAPGVEPGLPKAEPEPMAVVALAGRDDAHVCLPCYGRHLRPLFHRDPAIVPSTPDPPASEEYP